jgi:hypothetical protein
VDEAIAIAGAAAVSEAVGTREPENPRTRERESRPTSHFPAPRVTAAFAKGEPLLETDSYKVHASLREGPGKAEVHVRDTDIIYVLEGTATIMTGGTAIDRRTTAADEIRVQAPFRYTS